MPKIEEAAISNSGGNVPTSDEEMHVEQVKKIARNRDHLEKRGVLQEFAGL